MMISRADRDYIHKIWEEVYPRLYAKISKEERPVGAKFPLKHWKALPVRFNAMAPWKDAKSPDTRDTEDFFATVYYFRWFDLFARHYLGNHYCFLFLPVLRCFSSRGWLSFE